LQNAFDLVIATKDWHPPHHVSFASTHKKKPGDILELQGLKQELWPDHCIQGTPGAELPPSFYQEKVKFFFLKGTDPLIDSYSAFFDNAHLKSTGLSEYLKEHHVEEIYISGLATDYCVKYSVLDASQLGFKSYVILDACKGIELKPGDIQQALDEMQQAGATLITSKSIL
jgi:nicotinamidase/pyrazinamidase